MRVYPLGPYRVVCSGGILAGTFLLAKEPVMFTKARTATALFFITVVASLAVSLGAASPAGATLRICRSVVCIGSPNGCNIALPNGGGVLMFDEGDTLISAFGQKLVCKGGKWVPAAAVPTSTILAPNSGQIRPSR